MSILLKHAKILLRDENDYEVLEDAYLGVEGRYIDHIGTEKPVKRYDEEKDYTDKLLMPGLIDAHSHIPMVFLRGIADGLPLDKWLNERVFPIEAKLTAEQIRVSSYYAILELLASGVTSFTDMYFFPEETAQAIKDSGIKANLNKYILCFDPNQTIEESMIGPSIEFFDKYNDTCDGRLKVDFSIHAEYTNQPHIVNAYSEECKKHDAIMHIHLSESRSEVEKCIEKYKQTPVEWFESLGTFENPTCAAHVVWPMKDDLKILKKHDVSVMHNPSSNLMIGSGFAPVREMLDLGINVGLGTDGTASNNNLNMLEEMHLAAIVHNGYHLDATNIKSSQVIDMATRNGAKLQGRSDTGSLEVGKCADIIALDLNKIHLYPVFEYPSILTKSAQGSDVCMTMVDGKILYENGQYLTLDKEKIVQDFKTAVKDFYG
ncbi:MAG: amidohydrolase [Erysipelotrichaceae bacterium]|nr:amidohydrolase [Erysipelotrichaceae bacterium]